MTDRFEFDFSEPVENIVIFNLKGEITEIANDNFKREFNNFIEQGKKHFILNMRDVIYINSSGLGLLAGFLKNARKIDGEIKLAEVNKIIRNILEISKLTRVFELHDTLDSAINSAKISLDKNVY
ncbi:MAG: STAS domain-containing protein [Candidatus Muirbacterium halophilum]|nr:STAS domain-containing protein [Candidatus Muirbacterium halophilum]MCK9475690.1 STAS domain-containing protein [Candidatus Muirbacterium halophilum]